MKREYDWPYIRLRYESGETAYRLGKMPNGPSKQGIENRATKEGWIKPDKTETYQLPIVAAALTVKSDLLTDDLLSVLLGLVAKGSTQELACQAVGISVATWSNWKRQDPTIQDAVRRARAGKLIDYIGSIDNASKKDWKAAQYMLQTAKETRAEFGAQSKDSKLEVIINIDRAGDKIIDITPSETS